MIDYILENWLVIYAIGLPIFFCFAAFFDPTVKQHSQGANVFAYCVMAGLWPAVLPFVLMGWTAHFFQFLGKGLRR